MVSALAGRFGFTVEFKFGVLNSGVVLCISNPASLMGIQEMGFC